MTTEAEPRPTHRLLETEDETMETQTTKPDADDVPEDEPTTTQLLHRVYH